MQMLFLYLLEYKGMYYFTCADTVMASVDPIYIRPTLEGLTRYDYNTTYYKSFNLLDISQMYLYDS